VPQPLARTPSHTRENGREEQKLSFPSLQMQQMNDLPRNRLAWPPIRQNHHHLKNRERKSGEEKKNETIRSENSSNGEGKKEEEEKEKVSMERRQQIARPGRIRRETSKTEDSEDNETDQKSEEKNLSLREGLRPSERKDEKSSAKAEESKGDNRHRNGLTISDKDAENSEGKKRKEKE